MRCPTSTRWADGHSSRSTSSAGRATCCRRTCCATCCAVDWTWAASAAVTDATACGLLGHLFKMARASGVSAVIDAAAVPYLDGARAALRDGFVSGGTRRNLGWVRPHLAASVDEDELLLLADAQTSGGL